MWVHVFTVGTSILLNASRSENVSKNLRDMFSRWCRALPGSDIDSEICDKSNEAFNTLYSLVCSDPRSMSAELNAYLGIIGKRIATPVKKIYLLPTATCSSKLCSSIIEKYLKEHRDIDVEIHTIKHLGLGPEYFDEALLELLDELSNIVNEAKKQDLRVAINLTGGFKPESGFAILAASTLGIDLAYYIHEVWRDVVYIPIPPLKLDPEFKNYIKTIFKEINTITISDAKLRGITTILEELSHKGLIIKTPNGTKYAIRPWIRKLVKGK